MMHREPVPLLDLARLDEDVAREMEDAFRRVLRSGRYVLGSEVEALEHDCAAYCGVTRALGVSSGSDALLLSLMALGTGPGDEVICPTYTFFATAGAIWRTGAKPVFVDIDPESYNCDPDQVRERIGDRTRAVIPVHLFGQCADTDPIAEAAASRGIPLIEDAAQAIGAEYRGRRAGALGDAGCFSFFPSKNLGALGDGGLVTAGDDDLARRLRILRVHGGEPKYHHQVVGGNFRLDALQAAFLRVKLRRLEEAHRARQRNAALYERLLVEAGVAAPPGEDAPDAPVGLPRVLPERRHVWNQYILRVRGDGARDRLRARLAEEGIGNEVYYPIPLHLQRCFSALGHGPGDFPEAETAARETIAVPVFPELREDEVVRVAGVIASFCRS